VRQRFFTRSNDAPLLQLLRLGVAELDRRALTGRSALDVAVATPVG
jgi:hypothetical protein